MYKIYILINKQRCLKKKTRSYFNTQGFLADLRKRGCFCEVVDPKRRAW